MAKVAKRRGKYVLDYRHQSGIRRWETLPEGTTRKHADEALACRLQEVRRGEYRAPSEELTFDDLAAAYIQNHVNVDLRDSAAKDYRLTIEFHLRPYFGKYRLRVITRADIERFRADMLNGLPQYALEERAEHLARNYGEAGAYSQAFAAAETMEACTASQST